MIQENCLAGIKDLTVFTKYKINQVNLEKLWESSKISPFPKNAKVFQPLDYSSQTNQATLNYG